MYQNVAVNWDVFQYKFSGNPRDAFESLSYMLFCHEFGQKFGVFRYFNQPYIETIPVEIGENCIGFQAKYYDDSTQLSSKKSDLKDAIKGAKLKYPDINKIIFYINKELSASTDVEKTKPQYQIDIENCGDNLGVMVEWRVKSNFEATLLEPDLTSVRDYFFNPQEGIQGYLSQVDLHSKTILSGINSEIKYDGKIIKREHKDLDLSSFYNSTEPCFIIYGDGGSGKSGLVKDYFEKIISSEPIITLKATDFDVSTLSEFSRKFGEYTFEDYLKLFNDLDKKTCIIDSVEKVFTMNNQNVIKEVIELLIKYGWKIIFTIRTIYKDNFINNFLRGLEYQEFEVNILTGNQLANILSNTNLILPQEIKINNLLCNLFYLNLYIELLPKNEDEIDTIDKFIDCIWNYKIRDISKMRNSLHIRRENTICNIVLSCANLATSYYVLKNGDDYEAITALEEEEIIAYDVTMNGYYVCHDIYEELVIKYIIQDKYHKATNCYEVFSDIGNSLIVRKTLRLWIRDKFSTDDGNITDFIIRTLYSKEVESLWKDEILIALMGGNNEIDSLNLIKRILNKDDYSLLFRAIFLLNTTCRVVNTQLWNQILTAKEIKTHNIYRNTKPSGTGWNFIFEFVYDNRNLISWEPKYITLVIDTLHNWVSNYENGIETRYAGLIALFLYEKVKTEKRFRYVIRDEKINKISRVILLSALEIEEELAKLLTGVIDTPGVNHMDKYYDLCLCALSDVFHCGNLSKSNPELLISLAKKYWLYRNEKINPFYETQDIEDAFGINTNIAHQYDFSSALKTPIFALLRVAPSKTLDFIIELFDNVNLKYKESFLEKEYGECTTLKIYFPNGDITEQIASSRLWQMHRGTYPAPGLLESILMALERWLFFIIKDFPEYSKSVCLKLLSESHSSAITAVVVSMITAYPKELFEVACILIRTKEIFLLDNARHRKETTANFLKGMHPRNSLFDNERINTNNYSFRKKRLEDIIAEYQINRETLPNEESVRKLYKNLDVIFQKIEQLDVNYQFVYYRIDLRKTKLDTDHIVEKDGEKYIPLVAELPENLLEVQKNIKAEQSEVFKDMDIFLWGEKRFKKQKNEYDKYINYENNPLEAFRKAKYIWNNQKKIEPSFFEKSAAIYVFAVLIRDFKELLSKDDFIYCKEALLQYIYFKLKTNSIYQVGDGVEAAITLLPLLIFYEENQQEVSFENPVILLLTLILGNGERREIAVQSFSSQMWSLSFETASKIYLAYVELKTEYDAEVSVYQGISPVEFIKKSRDKIKKILVSDIDNSIDFSNLNENSLMTASMLLSPEGDFSLEKMLIIGNEIWGNLFSKDYYNEQNTKRNYKLEMSYISWLANFLIEVSYDKQQKVLKRLCEHLQVCNNTKHFLTEIIFIQDKVQKRDSFWNIWSLLQDPILRLCKEREIVDKDIYTEDLYYHGGLDDIVVTYLLANSLWNETAKSWHTLGKEDGIFFRHFVNEAGYNPIVLYAIGRVLNTIGYEFLSQGIDWLYEIVQNNPHLEHKVLQINAEYYIEEYMQRYIRENKLEFKKNASVRNKVITVLSFLVNRGSTCGYMLREEIV
ncbi:hypothetical protein CON50_00645 [Bacillus anthracis]|nr:hypothetical protein CON50_00645 [Bacillus anthracis]